MVENIIVGIVVVALVVAGVWMWWMENGPSGRDSDSEEKKEESSEK